MKILLVHKLYGVTGGAEVFFRETGRILEQNGHTVAYFSSKDTEGKELEYYQYFPEKPKYSSKNFYKAMMSLPKAIYSLETKRNFIKVLKLFKPDVVHVFSIQVHLSPSILIACSEMGIPVVMSCNDYKHICPNYKLYHHERLCEDCKGFKFYNSVLNVCCKNSVKYSISSCIEAYIHNWLNIYFKYIHIYTFSSEFMANKTAHFWGEGTFRWRMLRNPYNSLQFPLCLDYEDYVLYFGRLIDEKGVDVLIRAANLVPRVKIKIVGDGPDEHRLHTIMITSGVRNVEFLGPVWGADLEILLKKARFVVVPSVWHENFPYVINQAFSFGKAVIGSDRGGIPELIGVDKRGLIYPAENIQSLADAMLDLWDDPEKALALGTAAKQFSDAVFNDKQQYQQLISIYNDLLNL